MLINVFQEVNIKELADRIADDLQLDNRLLGKLKEGAAISGWSNAIVDNLQIMYSLEDKIVEALTDDKI